MSETCRFALIGGGRWAATHRNAVRAAGHRLTHVCVRTPQRRQELQDAWGVDVTTDIDALLASEVDAVIVASPNDLHAVHAMACLRAGKHVLVEKPMALNIADCRAMQAAARDAKRVLAPAMQMRLFGHFAAFKRILPELGPLRWLGLQLWRKPHGGGTGGWRTDDARRGSLWLEEPVHYFDLMGWFMADTVGAEAPELTAWAPEPTTLQARMQWPGGAGATFEYSLRAAGHAVTVRAVGAQASAELTWRGTADRDPQPDVTLVRMENGVAQAREISAACGHAHDGPKLIAAFAKACAGGASGPPIAGLPSSDDGSRAVAWCLAAARSAAATV